MDFPKQSQTWCKQKEMGQNFGEESSLLMPPTGRESGPGNCSLSTCSDFTDLELDPDIGIFKKSFQMVLPYAVRVESHWSKWTLFSDEETWGFQCLSGLLQVIQLLGWRLKSRFHVQVFKLLHVEVQRLLCRWPTMDNLDKICQSTWQHIRNHLLWPLQCLHCPHRWACSLHPFAFLKSMLRLFTSSIKLNQAVL